MATAREIIADLERAAITLRAKAACAASTGSPADMDALLNAVQRASLIGIPDEKIADVIRRGHNDIIRERADAMRLVVEQALAEVRSRDTSLEWWRGQVAGLLGRADLTGDGLYRDVRPAA